MSSNIHNNKRIVKNTLFLYVRMIFIMGVTLYTSRVVIDKLGVIDYGLYNAVGGLVAMLGFLNGTLSTGTSRFLTFELGTGNKKKLKSTFCTVFYSHVLLSLGIALVMETIGIWFIYHQLVIPPERLSASVFVFHISILTTIISITQVPYTSVIIAHENMSIYAYLGVFEALLKLIIVYLLSISSWDKLMFYTILIGAVQLTVALSYRFYCIRYYEESRLAWYFDKQIFRKMLSFSGWGLVANLSEVLGNQGIVVLINMFFQPAMVAAQVIGNQITNAMMQFISGFRTAINPQIIKLYAIQDYETSRKLTLQSSIYVFDLLLLIGLPAIVVMEPLLNLWLVQVPDYAVIFARYIMIRQILGNFSSAFYVPMMASGELKLNSYACVWICLLGFVFLYLLLRLGCNVMVVQYVGVIQVCLFSFIVKPYILCRRIDYSWSEILRCFLTALKVSIFPVAISFIMSNVWKENEFFYVVLKFLIVAMAVVSSAYMCLARENRIKLHAFVSKKMNLKVCR